MTLKYVMLVLLCLSSLVLAQDKITENVTIPADNITIPIDNATQINQVTVASIDAKASQVLEKVKYSDMLMSFFGTEYTAGENATVWLQLLRNYQPVNNAVCFITIYQPNKTVLYDTSIMTFLNSSDGVYYFDLITPSITGIYIVTAKCNIPANVFWDGFSDYSNLEAYGNITISGNKIVLGTYLVVQLGNVTLSPSGWWHLNENSGTTAYDSSGYGKNGLLSAGGWTTGKLNNCWTNNLVDTGITVSSFGNYERNESFSAEAWIYTTSTASQTVLGKMIDTGSGEGWAFTVSSNKVKAQLRNSTGGQISAVSYASVNDGVFHHIVMTYNGNSTADGIVIYVDGVENTTGRTTTTLLGSVKTSAVFSMGSRNLKQIFFYGKIDEVAVYNNYVLNQSEVAFRYNNSYGTERMNDSTYVTQNAVNGFIRSNPIILTGTNWLDFSSVYDVKDGSIDFQVLNSANSTLCSALGNITSCAGATTPIKLFANLSMPTNLSVSPEIDSWIVAMFQASSEEMRGSGEMHVSSASAAPVAVVPFTGTLAVSMDGSCTKSYPCGFTVGVTGAPAGLWPNTLDIWLLENGQPIADVFRAESTEEDNYQHLPYTINFTGGGSVNGKFEPGALLQVGKEYVLSASIGNVSANTSFTVENFRQPDLLGDALLTATYASPWIIFVFIVVFLLVFLIYLFLIFPRRR